ncbi:MAG: DUF420 domain-containing protein [Nitrososphaerales archaeon]
MPLNSKFPLIGTIVISSLSYLALSLIIIGRISFNPFLLERELAIFLLPHIIAINNAITLFTIIMGWLFIRKKLIKLHRAFMLTSLVLILNFLLLYLTRISLGGIKSYEGPEFLYLFIYLPLLTIHLTLAISSLPLVVYVALIGLTKSFEEIPKTKHPKVGKIAVTLWILSLSTGIMVYFMLF